MNYRKVGNKYFVGFVRGDDVRKEMDKFLESEKINNGYFSAIGVFSRCELAFYDIKEKKYVPKVFDDHLEVLSFSGNVSLLEGKPLMHAHCSLAFKDFRSIGGHFNEGIVGVVLEMVFIKMDSSVGRKFNSEIGLNLLDC
jgi:uncharacterized protein